jgi:hypothetical protein
MERQLNHCGRRLSSVNFHLFIILFNFFSHVIISLYGGTEASSHLPGDLLISYERTSFPPPTRRLSDIYQKA